MKYITVKLTEDQALLLAELLWSNSYQDQNSQTKAFKMRLYDKLLAKAKTV